MYESKDARDVVLKSPMESGVAAAYDRLGGIPHDTDRAIATPGRSTMIDNPEIVQTTAHQAAVIRLTIPRSEMMKAFGPAVQELMSTLADQGVKPVGAVFAHHLRMPPDMFDFELGVEVGRTRESGGTRQAGPASRGKGGAHGLSRSVSRSS